MHLPSRRKRTGATGALTAAALGALAVGVIAGPPDPGPGIDPVAAAPTVRAHAVPSHGPSKSGKEPPRILYLETTDPRDDIPTGPGGYIIERCPKGSVAINGYYFQTIPDSGKGTGVFDGFGLDDQGSSPAGYRKWAFYWDNVSGAEIDGVTFGLICDKDG